MVAALYNDEYVAALFDRMGPTYDLVNRVSSFGFCEIWRWQCVSLANIQPGDVVCDFMAGSGECWTYLARRRPRKIIAVDFSPVMVERQKRRHARGGLPIEIRQENATNTSLASHSVDCVVGAFGLKTLSKDALAAFARELHRILKPGGRFALLEISQTEIPLLGAIYQWYISTIIPFLGKALLGDIECYRMLGIYTKAFGSCESVNPIFERAGLKSSVRRQFFGCATAVVGTRP